MRKILPVLLALTGLGLGVAVGFFLRPATDEAEVHAVAALGEDATELGHGGAESPPEENAAESNDPVTTEGHSGEESVGEGGPEYVKMNNQFVVPVVKNGRVDAMVVLAISIEVESGNTEAVYEREPKLRDAFLQVMFDHANVGGFSGTFTDGSNLIVLRTNLKEAAAMILGTVVKDILITDIARQDS